MTRELTPLVAADLSGFAKALRTQWGARIDSGLGLPGHVELLNMLARAAGHRNVQALRSAAKVPAATPSLSGHGPRQPALSVTAERALRAFDTLGRLARWPGRRAEQVFALWCLWMAFDGKRRYSEREVNEILNTRHAFGDHCLLRRELVEMKLLSRTAGGAEYRKVAARPDEDAAALMRMLRGREAAAR